MQNKYLIIPLVLGIFLFFASGCKKEEEAVMPLVTTVQITAITPISATCEGNISNDGGAIVTERGAVWGTVQNPTVDSNTGKTVDGAGTGSFISNLTALKPSTTYYVRTYATNSIGTNYGSLQTFMTPSGIAVLTTNHVSDINHTIASCGGNILNDGGASITSRGVVWGKVENPTLDSYSGKTTDGTGKGSFISMLVDLTPNTTYFIRAYAINCIGIFYGNCISFETNTVIYSDGKTGTLTDVDGNIYNSSLNFQAALVP